MNALIIEATEDTPGINFNPDKNTFIISDRSLPENAIGFFQQLYDWLESYFDNPNKKTIFDFKLEYFNTSSAKQIAKILIFLEKLSKKSEVTIRWFYKKGDIDMLYSGSRYSKLISANFELIEF